MPRRQQRVNTGRVNRSARGAGDSSVHMITLQKRCNAKSASMRKLFDRWERKPNQSLSHAEFFDTMRLANVGGMSKASGAHLIRSLDPSSTGSVAFSRFRDAARAGVLAAVCLLLSHRGPAAPRHAPRARVRRRRERQRDERRRRGVGVVGQRDGLDTRIVLFVVLREGANLDEELLDPHR